jgi:hypothetical protein
MSETLRRVQMLVLRGEVRVSDHGFDELRKDGILITDVLAGVFAAKPVEDYPDRARGPSVLTLQHDPTSPDSRSVGDPGRRGRSGSRSDRLQTEPGTVGRSF